MKKVIIGILTALVTIGSAVAQENNYDKAIAERRQHFIYGPKVGLCSPYQNAITNNKDLKALLNGINSGLQLGGYMRGMLPIKHTPVVLYAQLDATFAMDLYFGGGSTALAGALNFPILIGGGYKLPNGMLLRGAWGPTYTVNLFSTANTAYKDTNNNNAFQSNVATAIERDPWGWAADIGVDWGRWSVEVRYMNQFRNKEEFPRLLDQNRYISWGLTVGYIF